MMDYGGYGWHWWGWLGPIFFWLVLILVIVAAVKYLFSAGERPRSGGSGPSSSAVSVLEERYARGEINRDEFLQKRDDIARR